MMYEVVGTDPKNLRILVIFSFGKATRQLRRTSEGAGSARRLSGWCGYDWRDSLYHG